MMHQDGFAFGRRFAAPSWQSFCALTPGRPKAARPTSSHAKCTCDAQRRVHEAC